VIDWSGGVGNFSPRHIIIPGSSIKGALNHRVQFHLNRLLDRYIDAKDDDGNNLFKQYEINNPNEKVENVTYSITSEGYIKFVVLRNNNEVRYIKALEVTNDCTFILMKQKRKLF